MRDALTITKLVTVFDVYDSVLAAVNSFPDVQPLTAIPPHGLTDVCIIW